MTSNIFQPPSKLQWQEAFYTIQKVLTYALLWPTTEKTHLHAFGLTVMALAAVVFNVTGLMELQHLLEGQDYDSLSTHMTTCGLYIGYTMKIAIFLKKRDEFTGLLATMKSTTFKEQSPEFDGYKLSCVQLSNKLGAVYVSVVAGSIALYLCRPLYMDINLPISFSWELTTPFLILIVILQISCTYYLTVVGISFDMLIIELINVATAQMSILNGTIRNFETGIETIEFDFFRKCIRKHCVIIRFVSEIESVFCYLLMTQCLSSITSICNAAFQLTHSGNIFSLTFMFNCIFSLNVLFEIGVCCFFANLLCVKSVELADACFSYNWNESSTRVKKLLLIMMMRAQRPLFVTAGKFTRLSIRSFLVILKAAYSYFALMQTLYDKNINQVS